MCVCSGSTRRRNLTLSDERATRVLNQMLYGGIIQVFDTWVILDDSTEPSPLPPPPLPIADSQRKGENQQGQHGGDKAVDELSYTLLRQAHTTQSRLTADVPLGNTVPDIMRGTTTTRSVAKQVYCSSTTTERIRPAPTPLLPPSRPPPTRTSVILWQCVQNTKSKHSLSAIRSYL